MVSSTVSNVNPVSNALYGGNLLGAPELLLGGAPADIPNVNTAAGTPLANLPIGGAAPTSPVFTNGTSNGVARTNSNSTNANPTNAIYSAVPSFDPSVNSSSAGANFSNPPVQPPFYMSPNLNDADEMRLYPADLPDYNDAPYGPGDLEWLYRLQDSDGASLSSRLASLAPVSFLNPLDGLRRRRMFALQSWEPTNFVWAYDNPGVNTINPLTTGSFPTNSVMNGLMFGTNPQASMNLTAGYASALLRAQFAANTPNQPYLPNPGLVANPTVSPFGTPSLAHRDRKINLNYPLPVSDNPSEPTRLKWIYEAYQLMLQILPPLAVDTPEEHAALSQYLTNVIDFRDPDATMTHFVSPDVVMVKGIPPSPALTTTTPDPGTSGTPATLAFNVGQTGTLPLEQFGMEYNPVALNEVLAYSFDSKGSSGGHQQVNRFYVELVNTLTESAAPAYTPTIGTMTNPINTSDLNLRDWDLILVPDDGFNRPDPTTGQVLNPALFGNMTYGRIPLNSGSFTVSATTAPLTSLTAASDVILSAMTTDVNPQQPGVPGVTSNPSPYFYVLSNQIYNTAAAPANPEVGTPTVAQQIAPPFDWFNNSAGAGSPGPATYTNVTTVPGANTAPSGVYTIPTPAAGSGLDTYYWLCLRRPASALPLNTGLASLDTTTANAPNPMVVVDAMRFAFIEGGGKGTVGTSSDTAVQGTNILYSWQRMQPFRGGHAVPSAFDPSYYPPAATVPVTPPVPTLIDTRYGYTEQMAVPTKIVNAITPPPGTPPPSPANTNFTYGQFGTPPAGTAGRPGTAAGPGNPPVPPAVLPTPPTTGGTGNVITQLVFHSLTYPNDHAEDGTAGAQQAGNQGNSGNTTAKRGLGRDAWDYFPFNDRDFTSVAELTLVPGCPPGLFTKQFVENNPKNITLGTNPTAPAFTPPLPNPLNPSVNWILRVANESEPGLEHNHRQAEFSPESSGDQRAHSSFRGQ